MDVRELGEFGLIARIATRLGGPASPAGPGDDAAIVPAPDGRVVASTDLLAEGVHFRLDWSSGHDIGVKAAAANLADIAAMGAAPTALLVGLAVPGGTPVAWVDDLLDGLAEEAARAGAVVVGGDTIASSDRITVAVTALGDLQGRAPVLRRVAVAGTLVYAGLLGHAAAGLDLLRSGRAEITALFPDLVTAHRAPRPPYELGPLLAAAGALALCDVSDGLRADLGHLLAPGVGADLTVPDDPRLEAAGRLLRVDSRLWQVTGGEDHGLLAVLPAGVTVPGTTVLGTVGGPIGIRGLPVGTSSGHEHFR